MTEQKILPPMDLREAVLQLSVEVSYPDDQITPDIPGGDMDVKNTSPIELVANWPTFLMELADEAELERVPEGTYVIRVDHDGMDVEMPIAWGDVGKQLLTDRIQPHAEDWFRDLRIALAGFPTEREIRKNARILFERAVALKRRMSDDVPVTADLVTFKIVDGQAYADSYGSGTAFYRDPETGQVIAYTGYHQIGQIGDWVNAAYVEALTAAVAEGAQQWVGELVEKMGQAHTGDTQFVDSLRTAFQSTD